MKIKKTLRFGNVSAKTLLLHFGKCLLLVFMLMPPKTAKAQLELYTKFNSDGSVEPIINYNGSMKINKRFSVIFFGLIRKSWSQALIGGSYMATDNLTLAASMGIEHGQSSPRYSGSVFWKKGKNSSLLLWEQGSGYRNYLYKINMFHEFSEKISLGVMDWRYHGLGPNFRYTIPKLASTIWIMPAYDHEQGVGRCMLGYSLRM
jgi:hypothetical protein